MCEFCQLLNSVVDDDDDVTVRSGMACSGLKQGNVIFVDYSPNRPPPQFRERPTTSHSTDLKRGETPVMRESI